MKKTNSVLFPQSLFRVEALIGPEGGSWGRTGVTRIGFTQGDRVVSHEKSQGAQQVIWKVLQAKKLQGARLET